MGNTPVIKPDDEDHDWNFRAQLAQIPHNWHRLRAFMQSDSEAGKVGLTFNPAYSYRFIEDYVSGKPAALWGGAATLAQKIVEAIASGGEHTAILKKGLIAIEELVPGGSSLVLKHLEKVSRRTDRAAYIAELGRACGILRHPSTGASRLAASYSPTGIQ